MNKKFISDIPTKISGTDKKEPGRSNMETNLFPCVSAGFYIHPSVWTD